MLRAAASTAVKEAGIETLIRTSVTEFKFVTNQLIADLQTAGRVHGGAQLVLFKDKEDQKHFSWLVVPLPPSSGNSGDRSPAGQAAFEAAWSKDQLSIHRRPTLPSSTTSQTLLEKMKFRRTSLPEPTTVPAQKIVKEGTQQEEEEDEADTGLTGGGRRGNSLSPDHAKSSSFKKISAKKAFKSFGKKLGSILPSKSTKGYSRSGVDND
ncbi:hypothetical protein C9890_0033 [Perkinsus sp. BL_2016]|nr:hypothetical protein C9890_0033 [Perkinsus sp. BL_2016]